MPICMTAPRLLDNSARIRRARMISIVASAARSCAPRYGVWTLGLLAVVALKLVHQELRCARSMYPRCTSPPASC